MNDVQYSLHIKLKIMLREKNSFFQSLHHWYLSDWVLYYFIPVPYGEALN